MANISLERLRFVSHGHSLKGYPNDLYCKHRVETMIRNIMDVFSGVHVKTWELGIVAPYRPRYWILYEWVPESLNGGIRLLVDERIELMNYQVWPAIRQKWIRQELAMRGNEEHSREKIGREWIRQELARKDREDVVSGKDVVDGNAVI
jgi:hypothetical protein